MENSPIKPEDVLQFQIERRMKVLFKNYLIMLEDMKIEHDEAMDKLYNLLPDNYKNYVELADYLSDEKLKHLRSRSLDKGNDCYRDIAEILKQFEIDIKQGKG